MSDGEIVEGFISALESGERGMAKLAENPFLGGRSRLEKSPGNFWITRREGKRWFTVYDITGAPLLLELFPPTPASTQPAG